MAMPGPTPKLTLPPISAAEPGTLYQQIVEGLKREVSEGRLPAGSALPSFRSLAQELLVSVITVKRAYEELERDGIIYRRQGLGTFVSSAAVDRSREAKTERARELLREALREATEAGLSEKDVVHLLQSIVNQRQKIEHEEKEPRHGRKRD
jgi:GntR family transcriptional regulator